MVNKTTLMGILNITPDSFSDGGDYLEISNALGRVREMIDEGADIIDIGGESTRPGATPVSADEEIKRVIPVIEAIRSKVSPTIQISIDTNKSEVAQSALAAGASMVNSMGGFTFDSKLLNVVNKYHCPIAIYHIKGTPLTMQHGEIVYDNLIEEIKNFFYQQIDLGVKNGLERNQFILDPGIGFGKTVEQNIEIIERLNDYLSFKLPIMVGVSRKSHLAKILQDKLKLTTTPTERIEGALAETAVAVWNGATIIRTHDILATKKFLTVFEEFRK